MKIVSGSNMQSSAMASRCFLEFQQLLDRLSSEKKFNGAVVVCKNGQLPTTMRSSKVIYGDIKDDTPLRIGSVTKLFTSIVVMKLVQNGKLNLNDTLGEKIPNCPERLKAIAIKQLLTHTSGLSNDFDDQSDIGQQKIIDAIGKKRGGLDTTNETRYSNPGFYLLGVVIETVVGDTFQNVMHDIIFEPLGMDRSLCDMRSRQELMASRDRNEALALNYHINRIPDNLGIIKNPMHVSASTIFSAGNIVSTPRDMKKFMESMMRCLRDKPSDFPVSNKTLSKMMIPLEMDGSRGLGLSLRQVNRRDIVGHGGIQEGFNCSFYVEKNGKNGVVAMSNMGYGLVDEKGRDITQETSGQPVVGYIRDHLLSIL